MYFLLHCINWEKSKDLIRSTYIDIRLKKKPHRGWLFIPFPIIFHILYTGKYSPPFSLSPPPLFALVVSGQI